MPDRQIQRIDDGEPDGAAGLVDAGHNAILVWGVNRTASNDSYIHVRRFNPAGVVTGDWEQEIGTDQPKSKLSGLSVIPAGADLWVGYWGHTTIYSQTPRHGFIRLATFPGILVPYHEGSEPRGASFDSAVLPSGEPSPPPNPTPGPGDPDAVARAVLTLLQQRLAQGGEVYNLFAQLIKDKIRVEIQKEVQAGGLVSLAQLIAALDLGIYNSNGLYQRLIETQFQVLRDNSVIAAALHELGSGESGESMGRMIQHDAPQTAGATAPPSGYSEIVEPPFGGKVVPTTADLGIKPLPDEA